MGLVLDHLRGHVLKCSAKRVPLLTVVGLNTPPEVTDFDDITLFDEDILWLDVSMDEALFVHVVNT